MNGFTKPSALALDAVSAPARTTSRTTRRNTRRRRIYALLSSMSRLRVTSQERMALHGRRDLTPCHVEERGGDIEQVHAFHLPPNAQVRPAQDERAELSVVAVIRTRIVFLHVQLVVSDASDRPPV